MNLPKMFMTKKECKEFFLDRKFEGEYKKEENWKHINIPWLAPSTSFGLPQRSSMMRLRSAALRSCSFFNSSAAFLRSNNYSGKKMGFFLAKIRLFKSAVFSLKFSLTRSFFFLSGVMKPFLAFLAFEASSIRLRTSARLRSISACLAFFAYIIEEENH